MSALHYVDIVGNVAKLGMILTLMTNTSLIYITVYHIKNIKGAYKFLVLLLAGLGIVFSVMEIFVHPFMHSFNASFVYFTNGDTFGSSKLSKAAPILIYSMIYLLIICVIAIQFIYRYLIIVGSKLVKLFVGWRSSCWLLYLSVFLGTWGGTAVLCLPDEFSIDYLKNELIRSYNRSSDDIAGFFIVAYVREPRGMRLNSIICTLGLCSALISQYVIIVYCGVKIEKKIRGAMKVTSSKTDRIQSQLFKTLVLQITAPSLFYHVPAFLMFIVPYFDIKVSFPSGVMVCFFSVYPAIDSVILMTMVTEYHRVIGSELASFIGGKSKQEAFRDSPSYSDEGRGVDESVDESRTRGSDYEDHEVVGASSEVDVTV